VLQEGAFTFNLGLPIGKMTVKPSATASRSQLCGGTWRHSWAGS